MRYSVPFRLIGEQVDVRLSDTRVTVGNVQFLAHFDSGIASR